MIEIVNCVLNFVLLGLIIYNSHQLKQIMKAQDKVETNEEEIEAWLDEVFGLLTNLDDNLKSYSDHTQQTLNADRITNTNKLRVIVNKIHEMDKNKGEKL